MIVRVPYKGKIIPIKSWTIGMQKDALLSIENESIAEKIHTIYNILIGTENNHLNFIDKLYLMMHVRAKINGETVDVSYICDKCGNHTDSKADIISNIHLSAGECMKVTTINDKCFYINYNGDMVSSIYKVDDIIDSDIIKNILDDLSVKDYTALENAYKDTVINMSINSTVQCLLCGTKKNVMWDEHRIVDELLIGMDLSTYYQNVSLMKMKLNFNIDEIENMLPFEQEVYISLCSDIIKKEV